MGEDLPGTRPTLDVTSLLTADMVHRRALVMAIVIRPCDSSDVPSLAELLGLLFAQESELSADLGRQQQGLAVILGDARIGRVYGAFAGEALVGMVGILFTISTAEGGPAAWLEDMVVHPEWRGQGVGERLMREAIQGPPEVGCTRVTLLTDGDNVAARRFYERRGFVRSSMVPMRLSLSNE
jgi:ribosomal protein S18 acetylase RimI-like enzyme